METRHGEATLAKRPDEAGTLATAGDRSADDEAAAGTRDPGGNPEVQPAAGAPETDPLQLSLLQEAARDLLAGQAGMDPDATLPEAEPAPRRHPPETDAPAEPLVDAHPADGASPALEAEHAALRAMEEAALQQQLPEERPARLAPPKPAFNFDPLRPYRGVVRRFFAVYKHTFGLLAGAAVAYVRSLPREHRRGMRHWFPRLTASLFWPFLDRDIRMLPFPQQLRRRLEILGPTYIKLGQVMAIREDLLPRGVTRELENLFDRLPSLPFEQIRERMELSLGRPLGTIFRWVKEEPLGSASIAQAHLAELMDGTRVVVKVIKPGIREVIESDLTLLKMAGALMQWSLPRYQPRMIINEFAAYTIKEVDYTFEADNADSFAANFRDLPDVVFPRVYRQFSSAEVLTMEFMDGFKPGSAPTAALTDSQRERVVDLGAASIIRMLYRDGFFHADLHAGNLMILAGPGEKVRVAFIDLGMVGRFEERTRRQMLYYFHALVSGDIDGATRYLADMATVMRGGDPQGFRRAVAELLRRFSHASGGSGTSLSIAQLILSSVGLGGRFKVFFPVEMTLMVKALVTFEGVGKMLDPDLDVAEVSQKHVSKIFTHQFNPKELLKQVLRGSPELVDVMVRLPQLLSSGARAAEEMLNNRSPSNPLAGLRSSILAAACIVGGVLAVVQAAPPLLWGGLFGVAVALALFGR
jgi:ubiquinone biosynthesis protein